MFHLDLSYFEDIPVSLLRAAVKRHIDPVWWNQLESSR